MKMGKVRGSQEINRLRKKVKSLTRALLETYEELDFLYELGVVISSGLELKTVAKLVIEKIVITIGAKGGSLIFKDPRIGKFIPMASFGKVGLQDESEIRKKILAEVIKEGKAKIYNELSLIPPRLCIPLKTKGRVKGAIYLLDKNSGDIYTSMDEKLLSTVASQIAVTIEGARRYTDMKERTSELSSLWVKSRYLK